ncbi:MAG: hypothetical protein LQ340_002193 [Diploschistes diacapsis]|nr:MAG: hypothetical protein LQ340_002193 [Diploschistes diacapsis]
MHSHNLLPTLLPTLAVTLLCISLSLANPLPRALLANDFPSNRSLELRDTCAGDGGTLCGWNGAYCCSSGQACTTSNNLALCVAAATQPGGGSGQVYTTTYVETDLATITTTYTVLGGGGGATPTSSPSTCNANLGESLCGSQCCQQDEWCNGNQCIAYGGSSSGAPAQSSTISNFIAPTSIGTATVTSAVSITTTIPFQTPVGSSGSAITGQIVSTNTGLSSGTIAGIVIGVLVGLLILFFVLACLCCRSIFGAITGKNKRKETTTYIETHHSHHGSGGAPPPRRMFGMLPGKVDRPKKESSGVGGLVGVGAGLAALAVILGLRRRSNQNKVEGKTEYTGSDYTYSYDDYTTSATSDNAPYCCSKEL